MHKIALAAAAALSVATFGAAAMAQDTGGTADFSTVDANHDGMVSQEEAMGAYPTLTDVIFNQADANGDGSLDEAEFTELQGLIGQTEGEGSSDTDTDASSSSAM